MEDPSTAPKQFWRLAKEIYGTKKNRSIPAINDNNLVITTSAAKADIFNRYFVSQSTLQVPPNHTLPPLILATDSILEDIRVDDAQVRRILKKLNVSKATGPDGIGNMFLKHCAESLSLSLASLFNKSFEQGRVPIHWKTANVTPVYKKGDKGHVKNYRPVSLLSNVAKVQERIVFDVLYNYCSEHNLLTWRNSGFKKLDSAMYQIINVTHQVNQELEKGKDLCLIFLDISKAFDKVWHTGLLHKLKVNGISGNLLKWFGSYLEERQQRVVINGQCSSKLELNAGVPQGSILGPLLFLIYINDILQNVSCELYMFADDTFIFEPIDNYDISFKRLNDDLVHLANWSNQWLVTFNADKTEYLKISRKQQNVIDPPLLLHDTPIQKVVKHKHLGVTMNSKATWSDHIDEVKAKAMRSVGLLRRIQYKAPRACLETLYKSYVRPIIEYGNVVYDGSPELYLKELEKIQRDAALICTGAYRHTSHDKLLKELGWEPLSLRRKHHRLSIMYKIQNGLAPDYITMLCPHTVNDMSPYQLRNGANLRGMSVRTTSMMKSFFPQTIKDWNNTDISVRSQSSLLSFKQKLKDKAGYRVNKLFSYGGRHCRVNHTRLRLGLSGLNYHRHKVNFIDDSCCPKCGSNIENPIHYFFQCPHYSTQRKRLAVRLADLLAPGVHFSLVLPESKKDMENFLEILLNGSDDLTLTENTLLFQIVQEYIESSRRFI